MIFFQKKCWPSFKFLWICHDKSKERSHWSEPVVQTRNEDPVSLQASALTGPEMVETGLSHALHRGEGGTKGGTRGGARGGDSLNSSVAAERPHRQYVSLALTSDFEQVVMRQELGRLGSTPGLTL